MPASRLGSAVDRQPADESRELLQRSVQDIGDLQASLVDGFRDGAVSTETARVLTAKTARLRKRLVRLATMVEDISHFAYHDPLTGLPNRALMLDRLQQAIAHADRHNVQVAVLVIDLNDFKSINDRHGHAAGDHLLRHVATMLQSCVRASDTACRFGGDEFVVVLPDITAPARVQARAEKIQVSIATPCPWEGRVLRSAASLGVALYPGDARTPEQLLQLADAAMFRSKGRAGARRSGFVTTVAPTPLATSRESALRANQ
ncbi:MAG: GGDEF domain-containing protein [Gammaproteobacteria bacterium]